MLSVRPSEQIVPQGMGPRGITRRIRIVAAGVGAFLVFSAPLWTCFLASVPDALAEPPAPAGNVPTPADTPVDTIVDRVSDGVILNAIDDSVLVLTHSWSGRTATVGKAWADMLGVRFLRFSDAPPTHSHVGVPGLTLEEIRPALRMNDVRRLYLGFPIWNLGPAPPAWRLLSEFDLKGIEVVPFFTYLHHVKPESLEALTKKLTDLGATVLPPIAIRAPSSLNPAYLRRRAHQALLARPDLWKSETAPKVQCSAVDAPPGHTLCKVPAGKVWLGDDGSETSPPGSPAPRRMPVAAFAIDRSEVTIAQYKKCETAKECPLIGLFDPCSVLAADGTDRPMPCVSVDAARAYCSSVGMRLPSEAEWVRAARGESANAFPWGSEEPSALKDPVGNLGEKRGEGMPEYSLVEPGSAWPKDGVARLAAGCSFPAGNSPFGVCDLAGNLGEWVEPVSNDEVPTFKGGTWMDPDPWSFRIATRGRLSLDRPITSAGFYLTGFRCARDLAE